MNLPGKIKYLVNLLESHIQMMDNKLFVKRGEHIQITDKEAEHEDVIYAIRNKWAELRDQEPNGSSTPSAPEMTFAKPTIQGFSSIEELKASEAPVVEAEVKEVDTKVETVLEEVKAEATKIEEEVKEVVKEVVKATKTSAKAAKETAST